MTNDSIATSEDLPRATSDPPRKEAVESSPAPVETMQAKKIHSEEKNDSEQPENEKKEKLSRSKVILAFAAAVLTLVAWALAMWSSGYASLVVAAAGVVCGFIGASRRAGQWRNLAITSIIASGVLAVVMSAFLIVITVGLS